MLPDVVVVADAGACEWRLGYVEDGGPSVILPAHVTADGRMDVAKLPDALRALESFEELKECALVLAEPPDESEAHRERAAAAAFTVQAVQAVCCYPAPLLAVYNAQFDTGVLVDVGFPATFIYIMYDGKSVLDGAVLHGLGGKHCGSTADASCDGLFDPSLLDDEHAAAKELCGLPEAIVRTVMLADVSLRQQLLGHIALVGGTSKLSQCPERLEEGLKATLVDKGATALMPRVFANPDRRLAQWLGGALLSQMTSAQGLFVSRDAFKSDPRAVHAPPRTVACRSLQAMEEHTAQTRATEAAARAAEAKATREHVHKQLEAARKFWLEQSPVGSSEERRRMRLTQIWQVRPIYERSLSQHVLAAGCSQTRIVMKRRRPKSVSMVAGDPDELIKTSYLAHEICKGAIGRALGGLREAVCEIPGDWGEIPGAANDAPRWQRGLRMRLAASWAVSALTTSPVDEHRIDALACQVHLAFGKRNWRCWYDALRAEREHLRSVLRPRAQSWHRRSEGLRLLRTLRTLVVNARLEAHRQRSSVQWRAQRLGALGLGRWVRTVDTCRSIQKCARCARDLLIWRVGLYKERTWGVWSRSWRHRRDSAKLARKVRRSFAGWRLWVALLRAATCRRHERLLGTLALCTHAKACARELERSLRQWRERVVALRRVNAAVARRASKAKAEGFHLWSWGVWHRRTRLLASLRESQLCKLADEHALERLWRSHCLHAWRALRGEGAKWRRDGRLASEALRRSVLRFQLRKEWRRMLQCWRASVARAQHAAQVRAGALIQGIAKQMRLDAFRADVRRQQQQAAVRRWRSAGVSDRWQRMMGDIEASWRAPRVYVMRVRRCVQRWSQWYAAQIPLPVRLRATGLLARRARGKHAEAWRRWRAEAQHRVASHRIEERTRRVHTAAFKAHGGSALHPPSLEQQYPWTEWAQERRQRLESALSRWQEEAQRQAQRLEAQQSLRGLGEGHAWAGRLQGLGLGPQHIAQLLDAAIYGYAGGTAASLPAAPAILASTTPSTTHGAGAPRHGRVAAVSWD